MNTALRIVVLGLSLSSSWGNGHATTYRALLRALARRGHQVLFVERDLPWYAANRDMPAPDFCRLELYKDVRELTRWRSDVQNADAVVVGSYVPDGVAVGRWVQSVARGVCAFYDIDTPVTLAKLDAGDFEYLSPELVPGYDLYLSFTGGPTLDRLMRVHGARRAEALYCSVDTDAYRPLAIPRKWDLSYLGTYSPDRQPVLERLLIEPARRLPQRRFCVAGPQYPAEIDWPANVERLQHVAPSDHAAFYGASRLTLNITRQQMVSAGFSPSVRLFEAAACGTAIISDRWAGLETVFDCDREIVCADDTEAVLAALCGLGEGARAAMARLARQRVIARHSAPVRAQELESHLRRAMRCRGREQDRPSRVAAAAIRAEAIASSRA